MQACHLPPAKNSAMAVDNEVSRPHLILIMKTYATAPVLAAFLALARGA